MRRKTKPGMTWRTARSMRSSLAPGRMVWRRRSRWPQWSSRAGSGSGGDDWRRDALQGIDAAGLSARRLFGHSSNGPGIAFLPLVAIDRTWSGVDSAAVAVCASARRGGCFSSSFCRRDGRAVRRRCTCLPQTNAADGRPCGRHLPRAGRSVSHSAPCDHGRPVRLARPTLRTRTGGALLSDGEGTSPHRRSRRPRSVAARMETGRCRRIDARRGWSCSRLANATRRGAENRRRSCVHFAAG